GRRHPLPRRDRRDAARLPGQAPALPRRPELPARGRIQEDPREHADRRGDQPRSQGHGRRRDLPRRSVLPPPPPPTAHPPAALAAPTEAILPCAAPWLPRISAPRGGRVKGFPPEAEQRLLAYDWPGNVREMRNLIERLVILCPGDRIGEEQLPLEFFPTAPASSSDASFVGEMEAARSESDAAEAAAAEGAPTALHGIGHAHIRMVLPKINR